MNISFVPTEILVETFSYLTDPKNFRSVSLVCKKWNEIINNTNKLWKQLCVHYMGSVSPFENSWKKRFKVFLNWQKGECQIDFYQRACRNVKKDYFTFILKTGLLTEGGYMTYFIKSGIERE